MATVVTRVYVIPSTISSIFPLSSQLVDADDILFYFKGGSNVISIEKTTRDNFNVMIPSFSKVDGSSLRDIIVPLRDDIENAMSNLQIPQKKPFLFDVKAKIVLQRESFMRFIPYWSTSDALFVLKDDSVPPYDLRAYYLSDSGAFTQLQALALFIAKISLARPIRGDWTLLGKKLLSYLASKEYDKKYDFVTERGPWDTLKLPLKNGVRRGSVDIKSLNSERLGRVTHLAMRMLDTDFGPISPMLTEGEDLGAMSLSDLIELGVDSLISSMPVPTVEITVDVNKDVFKAIILDKGSGACMVELMPGVIKTDEWLKEALETDNVIMIDNNLSETPDS